MGSFITQIPRTKYFKACLALKEKTEDKTKQTTTTKKKTLFSEQAKPNWKKTNREEKKAPVCQSINMVSHHRKVIKKNMTVYLHPVIHALKEFMRLE